jgi:geranylgeranyl transferase type-2 subunit alpha
LYDVESLKASAAAIATNVELYSMWNFRREIVQHFAQTQPDQTSILLQEELRVTERAIAENPKSYWVWHHRKWCGEQFPSLMDWTRELKLCDKLLMLDARNFHCWTYRRLIAQAHAPAQAELDFTEQKITANLSNYSAWHARSVVIGAEEFAESTVEHELELVLQAVVTEPRDSAPWLYMMWLVGASASLAPRALAITEELLEMEPECKGVVSFGVVLGVVQ